MREITEVEPQPETPGEILRHGLGEIAAMAIGFHQIDPCYCVRRRIKEYAKRILDAAES